MKLTGAQIMTEVLIEQGVTDVFGYPGGQVINLYDALYEKQDKLNHVLTAHEQGAAHAADGYARATGKVGVCIATSGPGATNLVTGIATAMMDSVPMVAITGNVSKALIGRDSFQEIDITGITLHITKHNYFVHNVEDLADTLREAFKIAKSGRPGPVLVDIPKDVQVGKTEFEPMAAPVEPFPVHVPDPDKLKQAAELMNSRSRPYIYVGGGALGSDCAPLIRKLADKIDAVIGSSLMGLSCLNTDEPRFLGMEGMHGHYASTVAIDNCDLIICVAARFSDRATGNTARFAKNASIIHLDVDFAEISKNVNAEIGIRGDLNMSLQALLDMAEEKSHPAWQAYVRGLKEEENRQLPFIPGMNPRAVIETMNKYTKASTPMATDVGQHQMWAAQSLNFRRKRTFLSSGGLGTMGFGMGAAIGAAFGTGEKTVLITGDGSFGMNLNEVATAVKYNVPLVIVLMNNGVLGMVRQWQTLFFNKHYSNTTLERKTDFVALAKAFGADGQYCGTIEEFEAAFAAAMAEDKGGVTLLEVPIEQDEFVLPMLPPGGAIADIITEGKA